MIPILFFQDSSNKIWLVIVLTVSVLFLFISHSMFRSVNRNFTQFIIFALAVVCSAAFWFLKVQPSQNGWIADSLFGFS